MRSWWRNRKKDHVEMSTQQKMEDGMTAFITRHPMIEMKTEMKTEMKMKMGLNHDQRHLGLASPSAFPTCYSTSHPPYTPYTYLTATPNHSVVLLCILLPTWPAASYRAIQLSSYPGYTSSVVDGREKEGCEGLG